MGNFQITTIQYAETCLAYETNTEYICDKENHFNRSAVTLYKSRARVRIAQPKNNMLGGGVPFEYGLAKNQLLYVYFIHAFMCVRSRRQRRRRFRQQKNIQKSARSQMHRVQSLKIWQNAIPADMLIASSVLTAKTDIPVCVDDV